MITDTAYIARRLQLLGEWDAALALLGPVASDAHAELRADISAERWLFQMQGHDEAEQAIAALDPATPAARMLQARLAYSRLLFGQDTRPEDRADAESGYRDAARDGDEATRGWAEFHWGVLLDNIDKDADAAIPHLETALELGVKVGDVSLESIAIRHLSAHSEPAECVRMLRHSLHLRAALGARPYTTAAQATLAFELPEDDPERAMLIKTYTAAAKDLRIAWLLGGGKGSSEDFED
jgi:hypothetical protein